MRNLHDIKPSNIILLDLSEVVSSASFSNFKEYIVKFDHYVNEYNTTLKKLEITTNAAIEKWTYFDDTTDDK